MAAVDRQLQWTTGKVAFTGERLEDVIEELNRYITRPLAIRDPALGRTPIGGAFDTRNADAYAEDLTAFFERIASAPSRPPSRNSVCTSYCKRFASAAFRRISTGNFFGFVRLS